MTWYIVWLVLFLAAILALGLIYSRKVETADQYVMADFSLGPFAIVGSIAATVLGSAAIIGAAGKGFDLGAAWIFSKTFAPVSILLAVILGTTIRKLKLYTIPDLFVRRFGRATGLIPAIIIAILYMTPTFGMQLVAMGSILSTVIHMPEFLGMLLGFVICVAFTLLGGMPSVAWTDAAQSVLIVAGAFILLFAGIHYAGGVDTVIRNTPSEYLNPLGGTLPTKDILKYIFVFGPFYLIWQTTWQRLTAARSPKVAVWSVSIGMVVAALISLVSICIGIVARQVIPLDTDHDLVYTLFLTRVTTPALGGFLMISLFAAVLTGATSFLLSGATNISKDIYQGWIEPAADDRAVLKVSRWSVGGMAVLGLVIALSINDIIKIYTYALSLSAITLVMPVMAAMFWERATKSGVMASIIVSLVFGLLWNVLGRPFGIHEILPGLGVSFLVLATVSLLTTHSSDEDVSAYYFSLKDKDAV
ncbi:sodium:solute symporter family protein [Salinisphaera aquimarina]|uniref:Sodium:solute symporter n=1 Tax=Salinisphaera aquimarina TaxID=2094031 RepID=A0ABV7ERZ7_9GAMM